MVMKAVAGIGTLVLAAGLAACGGSSSSSAPGAPAGSAPSAASSTPASGNLASTSCSNTYDGTEITGLGTSCTDVQKIMLKLMNEPIDAPGFWQPTTTAVGAPAGELPVCTWPNGGAVYDPGSSGDGNAECKALQSNHTVGPINMSPNG